MAKRKVKPAKTNGSNGKPPAEFQLTEVERMELENIQLKKQLAEQQMQVWAQKVQANHGFVMDNYTVNPVSGVCVRNAGAPATPPAA